jgi:ubiquinone/menaquinone biosynthesis C-methylase UbiE
MACHGGFSLDENIRRSWFNPEKILQDAGLVEGMVFVDVGSGDGFFTMLAAQVVGKTGRVYAVDTDAKAIDRLKRKATNRGFPNVKAIVAEAEENVFCDACADVIFYSIVLHDFNDPAKVLQNARRTLKPSGMVVDLDWKKQQMPFGPPIQIRFSEEKASALLEAAGFKIQNIAVVGPYHYIVTAKP